MASNLRVDSIVPATGSSVSIGTATGGVNIPGVLTYEDVTNVDSIGVITARSGIRIGATGANTLITGNGTGIGIGITTPTEELHIRAATPVIRLEDGDNAKQSQIVGSDGNLRLDADNNNAIADTNIAFRTDGGERLRIGPVGQIGIGGANYGTSGQVLTSQGSSSAVQWATPSSGDYVKIQRDTNGAQGASGFVFDNLDVSTFKFFDFNAAFVPETDGQYPYFRFRTGGASGADVTGSHYSYGYGESYPSNNYTQGSQTGHSQVTLSGTLGYNTNNGEGLRINMRIMFADANDNGSSGQLSNFITYQYIRVDASGNPRMGHGSAIYNQNTTTYPTGFRLYMASGGINSNSFGLYGMKR